jgi:hypothetical protein
LPSEAASAAMPGVMLVPDSIEGEGSAVSGNGCNAGAGGCGAGEPSGIGACRTAGIS